MSFQEKSAWAMSVILSVVSGWYLAVVLREVASEGIEDVAYQGLVLVAVIAVVVVAVVAHVAIAWAATEDVDKTDVRDREINRYGEYVGGFVLSAGAVVALGLAMIEVAHFWIANAILAGLVLGQLASLVTRIVLYRRGV